MTTTQPVTSRRDRARAATEAEIKAVARRQLAELGPDGVSLRGIAREMGMTAPGLYRYVDSLDELLGMLCADLFAEVGDAVGGAIGDAGPDLGARMLAAIRSFRTWAVDHPAEFRMMFTVREHPEHHGPDAEPVRRFSGLFFGLFLRMWEEQPFTLPAHDDVPPAACDQLRTFAAHNGVEVEERVLWVFASAWVRLYGVICLEVMEQIGFMFSDVQPYFEAELAAVAATVGIRYTPPAP